jgi:hypothetical protein
VSSSQFTRGTIYSGRSASSQFTRVTIHSGDFHNSLGSQFTRVTIYSGIGSSQFTRVSVSVSSGRHNLLGSSQFTWIYSGHNSLGSSAQFTRVTFLRVVTIHSGIGITIVVTIHSGLRIVTYSGRVTIYSVPSQFTRVTIHSGRHNSLGRPYRHNSLGAQFTRVSGLLGSSSQFTRRHRRHNSLGTGRHNSLGCQIYSGFRIVTIHSGHHHQFTRVVYPCCHNLLGSQSTRVSYRHNLLGSCRHNSRHNSRIIVYSGRHNSLGRSASSFLLVSQFTRVGFHVSGRHNLLGSSTSQFTRACRVYSGRHNSLGS